MDWTITLLEIDIKHAGSVIYSHIERCAQAINASQCRVLYEAYCTLVSGSVTFVVRVVEDTKIGALPLKTRSIIAASQDEHKAKFYFDALHSHSRKYWVRSRKDEIARHQHPLDSWKSPSQLLVLTAPDPDAPYKLKQLPSFRLCFRRGTE
jgi:hypothetical protein